MKSRFRFRPIADHGTQKTGILLTNLGTPDAPTAKALRPYLKEFLWDRRVVEIPRALWWLILNGIVLNTRPKKSAALYDSIWTEQGSPLLAHSLAQAAQLRKQLPNTVLLEVGMRYGKPSLAEALEKLLKAGATRLLVLPLYPQYSGSTTGSTFDAISDALRQWRWVPEWRFIGDYHAEPGYIKALANHLRAYWQANGAAKFTLFSFHGLPQHFVDNGDPYAQQCHTTARLLAKELALPDDQWRLSFQSRLGKAEWLQPYTDKTVAALPGEGHTEVDVFCPGFPTDCLETLEEIGVENRDYFLAAGGQQYRYIPAMNSEAKHIDMLQQLIEKHSQGWPEFN